MISSPHYGAFKVLFLWDFIIENQPNSQLSVIVETMLFKDDDGWGEITNERKTTMRQKDDDTNELLQE